MLGLSLTWEFGQITFKNLSLTKQSQTSTRDS